MIYRVSYQAGRSPLFSDITGLVKVDDGSIIRSWDETRRLAVKAIFGTETTGKEFATINVLEKSGRCQYRDLNRAIEVKNTLAGLYGVG